MVLGTGLWSIRLSAANLCDASRTTMGSPNPCMPISPFVTHCSLHPSSRRIEIFQASWGICLPTMMRHMIALHIRTHLQRALPLRTPPNDDYPSTGRGSGSTAADLVPENIQTC
ncbi:hypothetical protein B0T16DRAFT_108718 [Cercophora newfieldiana]|uniref:Uncharacterized protein n=1 Tax=Cercophora newfieldiana TaxID=92897 RepID=A0AA39YK11_9PEZI|nr:hypothetical protein B0T16DRAFT_108718 [Cercophora newfieldiana]